MFAWLFAPWLAFAGPSAQSAFDVERENDVWAFDVRWRGARGGEQAVDFVLPAAAVDADREELTWFPRKEYNDFVVREVRSWAKTVKGVEVTAEAKDGGVSIGARGPAKRAKAVLAKAAKVRDDASRSWLASHDFFTMTDGDVSFDHAKLVNTYAGDLEPVAQALQVGAEEPRAFAEKALSFVQAIPYEARKRNGKDPGYRRPLALLARNRGDCDSKAVLYLGLLRAEHPGVPLAVVYVPGHALVGVGVPAQPGDQTFEVAGKTFVMAEPVGPALMPLGETAKANRKAARRGQVRVVASPGAAL
jgi:hypothetical protein